MSHVSEPRPARRASAIRVAVLLALSSGAAALAQPNIATALGAGVPSSTGGVAPGTQLWRFDLDTSAYPNAVCNDLSPARIYLRRGSGAGLDRWHIHLQGGGGCSSGDSCAGRWKNAGTSFGAHKMSTTWAPPDGIRGRGILSPDPSINRFATWNHVYVYYCSSDSWSGRGEASTSASLPGGTVPYTIAFHGADILDAALATLRGENGPVSYLDGDQMPVLMPDLDEALTVLLAGSSAGGGGVIRSADRVRETLRLNNSLCSPEECDLRFAAVPDAIYGPNRDLLDWSTSDSCVEGGLCSYEDLMVDTWDNLELGFWMSTGESSCVALHSGTGDAWRCADVNHLLEHHVTSPFLARIDTQDSSLSGNLIDRGPSYDGAPIDLESFGQLVYEQLLALETLGARSEEPRTDPLEPPGAFGAQCGDHVTLSADAHFDREAPRESNGDPVNTNELLWEWISGTGDREAIEPFTGIGLGGSCGPLLFTSGFEVGDFSEWSLSSP